MSKVPPTVDHGQVPWLVFSHGKGQKYQTFIAAAALSDAEPKEKYLCSIPQLCDKTIMTYCRGWLLLRSNKNLQLFSLWNLISLETINLPPLTTKGRYRCVLLWTRSNPVVLLCDTDHPRIIFYRVADKLKWTIQDIGEEMKYIDKEGVNRVANLVNPVGMGDGTVFASSKTKSTTDQKLFLIEVESTTKLLVRCLQVGIPDCPHNVITYGKCFVESCDELLMVIKSYRDMSQDTNEISHVQIFKMDFPRMVWLKMDNLKDRAIFLGDHYSLSTSVFDSKIKGNCVYFIHNDGFYSFNKESESLSLLMPPSNIRKLYSWNWVMPNLRLGDEQAHRIEEEGLENSVGESSEIDYKIEKEGFLDKDYEQCVEDVGEKKGVKEEANLCDLSFDILEFIGKRLTLIDYMHFRITCRKFRMSAPAIQWRTTSFELENQLLYPCFMLFRNDMKTCDVIDPKCSERYFINFPGLLLGAATHSSKNGWLLMSIAEDSFYFFNPFTKMIRPLPKINDFQPTSIAFSSSPTSSECVVVGITSFVGVWTLVYVIRSRNGEWQEWEHGRSDNHTIDIGNNTPVFYDERFWFLGKNGELGVVKVREDGFGWKVLNKPRSPCQYFEFNYLVECEGELFSVFVIYSRCVLVFKLDLSKMIWLEVKSLRNHMFFVSYSSSFSMEAKIAGMENKIYFPRLRDHGIIFYSLDTEEFHTFTNQDSMEDMEFSSVPLQCGWIEPRWGL